MDLAHFGTHLVIVRVRAPLVHSPRAAHEGQHVSGAEIDAALRAAADIDKILGILHGHAGAGYADEREKAHFLLVLSWYILP